jgi:hypothetical protein
MGTKVCKKCKIEKSLNDFYVNKNYKGGYRHQCKECSVVAARLHRQKYPDKIKEQQANFRERNKEKLRNKYKIWSRRRIDNGSQAKYMSEYSKKNKISHNLRRRLQKALKGNFKSGSAVRDLGCSIEELKRHLESQFKPGMSWNNYGRDGWHIDHIIPLSKVDLSDREQLKKVCHYTNLQPLWAIDNLSKGNRISASGDS